MRRRTILAIPFTPLAAVQVLAGTEAEADAADRALRFVLNLYTGVTMKTDEWLAADPTASRSIQAYGGLEAMTKQSTGFAHQYGGVSRIYADIIESTPAVTRVSVRVAFRDDERRLRSAAVAEREEIIWRIAAQKVRGKWKLTVE